MNDDDQLSDVERRALARVNRPLSPPPALESRIVADLRARGLLRSPLSRWLRVAAMAAAVVVSAASGAWLQRAAAGREAAPGPRFVLLLYGGPAAGTPSRHAEYSRWARSVASVGVSISGEELSNAAEQVPAAPPSDGPTVSDAPRGYFVIATSSIDEARRIATSCPHLQYGGRIVIRAIESGS